MSTKFLSPGWRMPRNANQSKQSNYSMNFDATSSISLGTPSSGIGVFDKQVFSFSVWVKRERQNVNETIVNLFASSSNRGVELKFQYYAADGNYLCLQIGDVTNDSWYNNRVTNINNIMSLNVWYNITCTWDGTDSNIYINNVLRKNWTKNLTISYITSNQPAIGVAPNNSSKYLGEIDSFSYFDYVLSSSQITTLYGSSSTGIGNPMSLSPKPVAYYPLGESAGGFVGGSGTWLTENNAIGDYVFNFTGNKTVGLQDLNLGFNSTISYWVKNTSNTGNYMTNNGGTLINTGPYAGNEYYTFKPNNSAPTPNSASLTNSNINTYILSTDWVHWTAVRNGTGYELYANGQSIATATVANWSGYDTIVSGLGQNSLGMQGDGSNFLFWNTNLSSTEVETLYNYGSPIQTLANIPQSSNLKAWYKLDASDIYDSSITEWNNIEARANNKGSMLCGYNSWSGQALNQSYNSPVERSISIWVRRTASMGYSGVCNQQGVGGAQAYSQFFVWSNRGYTMSFFVPSPNKFVDFGYMAPDTWYHAVLTDTGVTAAGRFKTYWNGEFANASTDLTYDLGTPTQGFKWAGRNFSWSGGSIADGRLFDTVLSASEVETLYNNGAPSTLNNVKPNNLKQWLTFENIDTSVGGGLYDKSGNNNQLTTPLYPWVAARAAENLNVPISTLNGESSGMSQANLVQSDLQTVAPYSKYAIKFEAAGGNERIEGIGNTLGNGFSELSISAWVKYSSSPGNQYWPIIAKSSGNGTSFSIQNMRSGGSSNGGELYFNVQTQNGSFSTFSGVIPSTNVWYNVVGTYNGSEVKIYINNSLKGTLPATGIINTNNSQVWIGDSGYGGYSSMFQGVMSNISVWNTGLTSSQVTEIYNQGLPSNLNSHSAYSNLVSWWQLGENSSFDGNDWLFADEKGSNNGESINMTISDLVNGVGTTANGVSSGMSEGSLVGDAPYSTANALSSGMAVTARGTDVP